MADGPPPDPSMFVGDNAFRLFHQYHSSVVALLVYLANTAWIPQRTFHHAPRTFSPHHPPLHHSLRRDPTAIQASHSQPSPPPPENAHAHDIDRHPDYTADQPPPFDINNSCDEADPIRLQINSGPEAQTSSHRSHVFAAQPKNSHRNFLPFLSSFFGFTDAVPQPLFITLTFSQQLFQGSCATSAVVTSSCCHDGTIIQFTADRHGTNDTGAFAVGLLSRHAAYRLFSTRESTSLLSTISYPSARTPAPSLHACHPQHNRHWHSTPPTRQ